MTNLGKKYPRDKFPNYGIRTFWNNKDSKKIYANIWENKKSQGYVSPLTGKKQSEEHIKNVKKALNRLEWKEGQSKRVKKLWKNPEYLEKMKKRVESMKTEEYRQKMSVVSKKMWKKKGHKKLMTKKMKEMWKRPEHRKKVSKTLALFWNEPKNREKRGKISKKLWKTKSYIDTFVKSKKGQDTRIEKKIEKYLKLLKIKFIKQYWFNDGKISFISDFYLPDHNLIIECDGCYWHNCPICFHNKLNKKIRNLDDERTNAIKQKRYKILRLWEHEINLLSVEDLGEIINESCKS